MSLRSLLVRRVFYPLDCIRLGARAELAYRREFEESQFWSQVRIEELQLARLRALVEYANEQCPFYRSKFAEVGFRPADLQSLADSWRIPILSKREIQQHRDAMCSRAWAKEDLVPNRTGGSTGSPLSFFLTPERAQSRAAATWRHNRWAGYEVGDKLACLWGAAQDAPQLNRIQAFKQRLLAPTLFLNTAHLTEASLHEFAHALPRFRPRVMLAYAKSAVLFARFILAAGIVPYRFKSIITSAEVLEPTERQLLETTFGCPVFNRYGCREVSVIASECEEHQGLHVMAEGLLVEVTRNGASAPPGKSGKLVITDLLNFGMPLIRYEIGDVATRQEGLCPCGRGLPRLRSLEGRVTDFLVGADDRIVSGAALTIALVANRPSLGQVQIVQAQKGQVMFRVAPGDNRQLSSSDFEFLRTEARKYLGEPLEFEVEQVATIAAEQSGKYLFSKSTAALPF